MGNPIAFVSQGGKDLTAHLNHVRTNAPAKEYVNEQKTMSSVSVKWVLLAPTVLKQPVRMNVPITASASKEFACVKTVLKAPTVQ